MSPLSSRIAELLASTPQGLTTDQLRKRLSAEPIELQQTLDALSERKIITFGRDRRWRQKSLGPSTPSPSAPFPTVSPASLPQSATALRGELFPASIPAEVRSEPPTVVPEEPMVRGGPEARFRALIEYYRACVAAEAGGDLVTYLDRLGKQALPIAPRGVWWPQENAGTRILVPLNGLAPGLVAKLSGRRGEPAFLGWPLECTPLRGPEGGWRLRPVTVWPCETSVENGVAVFRPLPDGLQLNQDWLDQHKRRFGDTRLLAELLGFGLDDGFSSQSPVAPRDFGNSLSSLFSNEVIDHLDPAVMASSPAPIQPGLHNRALVMPAGDSRYTVNLARDLARVAELPASRLAESALGPLFSLDAARTTEPSPAGVVELIALNAEQARAARDGLSARLTVVTGPPGTGKSQVVAAVMLAAAAEGKTALFASRNHAAIDAVHDRIDQLSKDRPLCVRISAPLEQGGGTRISRVVDQLLSRPVRPGARDELVAAVSAALSLDQTRAGAEDELTRQAIAGNDYAGAEVEFSAAALDLGLAPQSAAATDAAALDLPPDPGRLAYRLPLVGRMLRTRALRSWQEATLEIRRKLAPQRADDMQGLWDKDRSKVANLRRAGAALLQRRRALAPETTRRELAARLSSISAAIRETEPRLLRVLGPALDDVSVEDRQALTTLRGAADIVSVDADRQAHTALLTATMGPLLRAFPLWSSTSLSVGGRLPLLPALFDLVIIDEASQHDIAASIPLLARARRAMVVGDPAQLPQVSKLAPAWEAQALRRAGLLPAESGRFIQSRTSLFHLAASTDGVRQHMLLDHFRCHADIAGFVSDTFYGGALRVRTDMDALRASPGVRAGLHWTNITGRVEAAASGCHAPEEARAVVAAAAALLKSGYRGTIGITTPFAEQAKRINDRILSTISPSLREQADLRAMTTHRFQGDARDVMLLSLCANASTPSGSLAFLRENGHLINVAVSRARAVCHVFADEQFALASGIRHLQRLAEAARRAAEPAASATFESPWEERLYRALRARDLNPMPQYPIAGRRLDLALIRGDTRLDIEVDGDRWHRDADGLRKSSDLWRDHVISGLGWKVLRFWVYELRENMDACIERIIGSLGQPA